MRKIVLIVGVFVIAAILVGGYLLTQRSIDASITVFKEEGSVMFKPENGQYTDIDSDEKNIPNHSFVKTSEDGIAEVVLPDNSMISLSSNTEMQINYDANISIIQNLGKAWFRVRKLAGQREFTVQSSSAIASVRGTIFGLEHAQEDVIYVTQSQVEIAQLVEENGKKVKKNIQSLGENKLAKIFSTDKNPEVVDLPQEKKDTPWFRRNEIINEEFKNGNPRQFIKKLKANDQIKKIDDEIGQLRKNKTLGAESNGFLEGFTNQGVDSTKVCESYNSSQYQEGLDEIANSKELFGAWGQWFLNLAEDLKKVCQDGQLSPSEAEEIQKIYGEQPPATFIPPVPNFGQ